jgi:hypothetical protein
MANTSPNAGFTNAGPYNSYYNVQPTDSFTGTDGWPAGSSGALAVAQRICALTNDNSNGPGFATPNKPVIIHVIAFGAVFEPGAASGSEQANAVSFLQSLSSIGGTVFPSSSSDPTYGYKWCIGTQDQRMQKLRTAFGKVMDDGIAVVMVR